MNDITVALDDNMGRRSFHSEGNGGQIGTGRNIHGYGFCIFPGGCVLIFHNDFRNTGLDSAQLEGQGFRLGSRGNLNGTGMRTAPGIVFHRTDSVELVNFLVFISLKLRVQVLHIRNGNIIHVDIVRILIAVGIFKVTVNGHVEHGVDGEDVAQDVGAVVPLEGNSRDGT